MEESGYGYRRDWNGDRFVLDIADSLFEFYVTSKFPQDGLFEPQTPPLSQEKPKTESFKFASAPESLRFPTDPESGKG